MSRKRYGRYLMLALCCDHWKQPKSTVMANVNTEFYHMATSTFRPSFVNTSLLPPLHVSANQPLGMLSLVITIY